jgi:hypothetical protein
MQQQVCRSAKSGMQHHGVADRGLRQDLVGTDAQLVQAQDGAARASSGVKPNGLS